MPTIRLVGGEQDYYKEKLVFDKRPDVFYVFALSDFQEIKDTKDPIAKVGLKAALSRLAYVFDKIVTFEEDGISQTEYRYIRCEELDKGVARDATSL